MAPLENGYVRSARKVFILPTKNARLKDPFTNAGHATPSLRALRDDIISSYKLFDALCEQFQKNKYELKKAVLSDQDETTVYWDALAKKGKSKYGLLVLSPSERLDLVTAERIIAKKRTSNLGAAAVITAQKASAMVQGKLRREKIAVLNPEKSMLASESEIKKFASEIAPELS